MSAPRELNALAAGEVKFEPEVISLLNEAKPEIKTLAAALRG